MHGCGFYCDFTPPSLSWPKLWSYSVQGGEGNVASVISQTLENAYQTDSDSEIPFESGGQKYILNLKGIPLVTDI